MVNLVTLFMLVTHEHQLLKLHGHHKCHHLTPGSYLITTTHIESPPHIWDDFVGAYTPILLVLMGILVRIVLLASPRLPPKSIPSSLVL
jgi:hypothetical protein